MSATRKSRQLTNPCPFVHRTYAAPLLGTSFHAQPRIPTQTLTRLGNATMANVY